MWWVSTSTSYSSTLPLVQHDVVHGIVAQVLLRVDVEVLQVLRVHLTTPVPEENWHVRKLILCFQFLALGVKTPGPENGIFFSNPIPPLSVAMIIFLPGQMNSQVSLASEDLATVRA